MGIKYQLKMQGGSTLPWNRVKELLTNMFALTNWEQNKRSNGQNRNNGKRRNNNNSNNGRGRGRNNYNNNNNDNNDNNDNRSGGNRREETYQ